MKKQSNLNIPNILSTFRLIMVPVFVYVYFKLAPSYYPALIVYIIAQGTDVIDGYIARRFNQITRLGRLLDPMADKLMSFTVLTCLAITYNNLWWAVIILFLKEFLMAVGALVLYKRITDIPPANKLGKASTVYFYCLFIIAMLLGDKLPEGVMLAVFAIGVVLTVIAFTVYARRFLLNMRTARDNRKDV